MSLKEILSRAFRLERKPKDPVKEIIRIVNTESKNKEELAIQLSAIERLGESGSYEALKFLRRLYSPKLRGRSTQGITIQGVDVYPLGDAEVTKTYSFPRARGLLVSTLHFTDAYATSYGSYEFAPIYYVDEPHADLSLYTDLTNEELEKRIEQAKLSNDEESLIRYQAHRTIRTSIAKLKSQLNPT